MKINRHVVQLVATGIPFHLAGHESLVVRPLRWCPRLQSRRGVSQASGQRVHMQGLKVRGCGKASSRFGASVLLHQASAKAMFDKGFYAGRKGRSMEQQWLADQHLPYCTKVLQQ